MKRIHRIIGNRRANLVGLAILMLSPPAWAYLDPSTGSMILSAIVGLFATLALAVKTYWYKLKSLFRRDTQQESASTDESAAEPESSADH